jgi:hypothetical protein
MNAKNLVLIVCSTIVPAMGQNSNNWWPPRILLIEREEVQPGKMPQYESLAMAYAAALDRARVTTHRVGLNMAVGGDRERVYLSGYESMEALERGRDDWGGGPLRAELENLREKASEILASRQTLVGVYRHDLSYRPTGFNSSEIRYVMMNQHLTTAANEAKYVADIKAHMDVLNKADANRHWYLYQVIAGAPTGTGILIEPFRSLREMDPFVESSAKMFESIHVSPRTPEIGIFMLNLRTSYPR